MNMKRSTYFLKAKFYRQLEHGNGFLSAVVVVLLFLGRRRVIFGVVLIVCFAFRRVEVVSPTLMTVILVTNKGGGSRSSGSECQQGFQTFRLNKSFKLKNIICKFLAKHNFMHNIQQTTILRLTHFHVQHVRNYKIVFNLFCLVSIQQVIINKYLANRFRVTHCIYIFLIRQCGVVKIILL